MVSSVYTLMVRAVTHWIKQQQQHSDFFFAIQLFLLLIQCGASMFIKCCCSFFRQVRRPFCHLYVYGTFFFLFFSLFCSFYWSSFVLLSVHCCIPLSLSTFAMLSPWHIGKLLFVSISSCSSDVPAFFPLISFLRRRYENIYHKIGT